MIWVSAALACEAFGTVTALTPIQHPELQESSGLAASRETPGALWTHDDSGESVLFRFRLDGEVTRHELVAAGNADWEDLASADCPGSGSCVYVGDIGEDRSEALEARVYVAREPKGDGSFTLVEQWNLRWPQAGRDGETLLVHPCTLQAWIVTRGEPNEVFAISEDRGPRETELIPLTTLPIDEEITSGDFAPDGSALVLRSDRAVYRIEVVGDEPQWDAPERLFTLLQTGEAIAWELDGDLVVTDEGQPTPLGRIPCTATPPSVCEAPARCGCRFTPRASGLFAPLLRR